MKFILGVAFYLAFGDNIYISNENPPYPWQCWEEINPKIFYIVDYNRLKMDSLGNAMFDKNNKEITYISIDTINYREMARHFQEDPQEIIFH